LPENQKQNRIGKKVLPKNQKQNCIGKKVLPRTTKVCHRPALASQKLHALCINSIYLLKLKIQID
jgi:hypothetical protein